MQEDDRALVETLAADPVEQPGHGLAGIHRVEQHRVLTGQQFHRRQCPGIRFAVTWAEVFVPQLDLEVHWQFHAQQVRRTFGQTLHFRALIFFAARDGHADHRQLRQRFAQRQRQTTVGPGAARGQHHGGEFQAGVLDLLGQFQTGTHVAQCTESIGATDRHQIRFLAIAAQAHGECGELFVGVVEVVHQLDLGVEQIEQQAVAVAGVVAVVGAQRILQQRHATQAESGRQCGGLAYVIRLQGAGGDQRVGALSEGIGGEVFEFAQLVAAHGQRRQVIAFDVHIAAQPGGQAFEFFQRRRLAEQVETVKAIQLLFDHEPVLAEEDDRTIGRPF